MWPSHLGAWRSLVAHSAGGRAVAGSNPVAPIGREPALVRPYPCRQQMLGALRTLVVPAVVLAGLLAFPRNRSDTRLASGRPKPHPVPLRLR
jgi:hypothetical protein